MDDFFRSSDNGLLSHPSNRQFLRKLFESAAMRLGLQCREEFAHSDGGTVDVAAVMDALSLPRSAEGWAQAMIADISVAREAGRLPVLNNGSLVIGWGMPPSLMNYIDSSGAAFIDLEIDPIRFTKHLRFCARTNDRATAGVLARLRGNDEHCWNDAAALKGYFARRGAQSLFDPRTSVGLFIGQTSLDLALVTHGRLARPADASDRVRKLAQSVDLLVIKPHPYETSTSHLSELASDITNVAWTSHNVYALLCAENLSFVCGLSSGTLQEAKYFLKSSERLIEPDRNDRQALPKACSDWIPVPAAVASIEAMTEICRPFANLKQAFRSLSPKRTKLPLSVGRFRDDALDHAFGMRWGLDATQAGLPASPRLQPDHIYRFSDRSPARAWLGIGWSTPEPWGVWSDGARACVVIPLDEELLKDSDSVEVQFEGQVFSPANATPSDVLACINGNRGDAVVFGGEGSETPVRISLRVALDSPRTKRVLLIEFAIRTPMKPTDLGMSPDARSLGFGLQRLCISTQFAVPTRAQDVAGGGAEREAELQET
ncbi:hypothetical protein [Variovorax sp. MHTC-1]|uniref:hypothetical protein n=1 Tax=Variovorax sp. MHTC-1 TaxID=2495593 RepID=UPI000F890837|nr:hypothetical protein [Variovorax sp. MHTC-1]RST54298.1 hypothetical protein EJI01_10385 [Variovorax sp. MHTC-1]